MITLEPGGEVRRRRVKESRNLVGSRDREGLRLCPAGENHRKLREEIGQKATERRMRRVKDIDMREENEKSIGGRGGGEAEVRMRKEEGRRILGGGGNPEGREGRSWIPPRLSSPAVQVPPPSIIMSSIQVETLNHS